MIIIVHEKRSHCRIHCKIRHVKPWNHPFYKRSTRSREQKKNNFIVSLWWIWIKTVQYIKCSWFKIAAAYSVSTNICFVYLHCTIHMNKIQFSHLLYMYHAYTFLRGRPILLLLIESGLSLNIHVPLSMSLLKGWINKYIVIVEYFSAKKFIFSLQFRLFSEQNLTGTTPKVIKY